jgi:LRR receptor-like serine/threonine-protein kinase FLS2
MSSLRIIGFGLNNLTGSLPSNLFNNLPNLEGLYLSRNLFHGQIPAALFGCTQLKILSVL